MLLFLPTFPSFSLTRLGGGGIGGIDVSLIRHETLVGELFQCKVVFKLTAWAEGTRAGQRKLVAEVDMPRKLDRWLAWWLTPFPSPRTPPRGKRVRNLFEWAIHTTWFQF